METTHNTHQAEAATPRLERPAEGRVLGGVALAVSRRTGASVALVRLGFLITALFGGTGVILYAAAWALVPGEAESESQAERWLTNLTTPGRRVGAFLVGIAGLIVVVAAAPATLVAAVILLAAAALLADGNTASSPGMARSEAAIDTEQAE
jgi:phage shock protein PspC (stress-responsive transcriptional regulator)